MKLLIIVLIAIVSFEISKIVPPEWVWSCGWVGYGLAHLLSEEVKITWVGK
jgi:hypothetical protein